MFWLAELARPETVSALATLLMGVDMPDLLSGLMLPEMEIGRPSWLAGGHTTSFR
jgi:hypothetical protein